MFSEKPPILTDVANVNTHWVRLRSPGTAVDALSRPCSLSKMISNIVLHFLMQLAFSWVNHNLDSIDIYRNYLMPTGMSYSSRVINHITEVPQNMVQLF